MQENDLKSIKSYLVEFSQVKDELKKSNEFKPNLFFDKNSYGQLNLGDYSSFDPFQNRDAVRGAQY